MTPRIHIGTSGWNYHHWRGGFYPPDCPKAKWLQHYTKNFTTVEVNATFYGQPKPETFKTWRRATPDGFLWAVKANRYITHIKRLRDVHEPLERFFGAALLLKEKLGPVLFQLPPGLAFHESIFDGFCENLEHYKHPCALEVPAIQAGLPTGFWQGLKSGELRSAYPTPRVVIPMAKR
jgi:uncharacterized protein YecE (DUF72 family)